MMGQNDTHGPDGRPAGIGDAARSAAASAAPVSYRQGDIVLVLLDAVPAEAVPARRDAKNRIVFSLSENTGHAHVIHEPDVQPYRPAGPAEGAFDYPSHVVVGAAGATLSHELVTGELAEHRAVHVPQGAYEAGKQVEYKPLWLSGALDQVFLGAGEETISLESFGWDDFVAQLGAEVVDRDVDPQGHDRDLVRIPVGGEGEEAEPIFLVRVTDAAPHPVLKRLRQYLRRVDPGAYGGRAGRECRAAVASSFHRLGDLDQPIFASPEDFEPCIET
jgi:hypothetical protein